MGDVTIPKGAMIDIPIYMLQHLPEYWEEPEEFIPERYVAYSGHIVLALHACEDSKTK